MSNAATVKTIWWERGTTTGPVDFSFGTAFYNCNLEQGNQGEVYRHQLSFNIPGMEGHTRQTVSQLRRATRVHFTDTKNTSVCLGSEDVHLKVTYELVTPGKPGAFRGYQVKVTWSSLP